MRITLERILCPVDFSKTSSHATPYAVAMAKGFHAQLLLLNVLELPAIATLRYYGLEDPELGMADVPFGIAERDLLATERQAVEMENLAEQLRKAHGCDPVILRRTGKPFVEVIRAAREENVDLIVMGTHGRTGLPHVLIGSTAEKVVRMAPCPVLTVKHPQHEFVLP